MRLLAIAWLAPCAVARAGVITAFTEEAQSRGINYVPVFAPAPSVPKDDGQGIAVADLDDDGDPDVILLGDASGVVGVYENDGTGNFIDRSTTANMPLLLNPKGAIAGDYDNDGDLDVYLSQGTDYLFEPLYETRNFLMRNDGGFQFADVTTAGIRDVGDSGPTFGCAWGDYNNDGLLDLYVSNRFTPNRLFRNLGNGNFTDAAPGLGVDRGNDPTYQSAFFDYDKDGDADLYVANDKADCSDFQNHFFENTGGTFVETTNSNGTAACVWSMCIALGDFSRNGFTDMYVTNLPIGNALMINDGAGAFTREEVAAGVESYAFGWGATFLDFDNDAALDLYVCNAAPPAYENNRLYTCPGGWPCADVGAALGVEAPGNSFATATGDVDGDGDLDLFVLVRNEPIKLFINREGSKRQWAKFDVRGEGAARYAVGAVVTVVAGGITQIREVIAGSNYLSQNELTMHFGLMTATSIDSIHVLWPGGNTRTLTDYPASATWRLYPVEKLGDFNGDGARTTADAAGFSACMASPQPATVTAGCEVMDMDGDGDVDLTDYAAFCAVVGDGN